MPDLEWNRSMWDRAYHWEAGGEEWSAAWGGSEAQWFGTLLPRLCHLLPAKRILEIGPGLGRWTRFLASACSRYVGVDLANRCILDCRERFKDLAHAEFKVNDGLSLDEVDDASFDLVFSFDSLVHAEADVIRSYIPQILNKLSGDGVAFIHHSNLNGLAIGEQTNTHYRAGSVSGQTVEDLVSTGGGHLLIQEQINWLSDDSLAIDCISTFCKAPVGVRAETTRLLNQRFADEASIVATFHAPYGTIRRRADGYAA